MLCEKYKITMSLKLNSSCQLIDNRCMILALCAVTCLNGVFLLQSLAFFFILWSLVVWTCTRNMFGSFDSELFCVFLSM